MNQYASVQSTIGTSTPVRAAIRQLNSGPGPCDSCAYSCSATTQWSINALADAISSCTSNASQFAQQMLGFGSSPSIRVNSWLTTCQHIQSAKCFLDVPTPTCTIECICIAAVQAMAITNIAITPLCSRRQGLAQHPTLTLLPKHNGSILVFRLESAKHIAMSDASALKICSLKTDSRCFHLVAQDLLTSAIAERLFILGKNFMCNLEAQFVLQMESANSSVKILHSAFAISDFRALQERCFMGTTFKIMAHLHAAIALSVNGDLYVCKPDAVPIKNSWYFHRDSVPASCTLVLKDSDSEGVSMRMTSDGIVLIAHDRAVVILDPDTLAVRHTLISTERESVRSSNVYTDPYHSAVIVAFDHKICVFLPWKQVWLDEGADEKSVWMWPEEEGFVVVWKQRQRSYLALDPSRHVFIARFEKTATNATISKITIDQSETHGAFDLDVFADHAGIKHLIIKLDLYAYVARVDKLPQRTELHSDAPSASEHEMVLTSRIVSWMQDSVGTAFGLNGTNIALQSRSFSFFVPIKLGSVVAIQSHGPLISIAHQGAIKALSFSFGHTRYLFVSAILADASVWQIRPLTHALDIDANDLDERAGLIMRCGKDICSTSNVARLTVCDGLTLVETPQNQTHSVLFVSNFALASPMSGSFDQGATQLHISHSLLFTGVKSHFLLSGMLFVRLDLNETHDQLVTTNTRKLDKLSRAIDKFSAQQTCEGSQSLHCSAIDAHCEILRNLGKYHAVNASQNLAILENLDDSTELAGIVRAPSSQDL